MVRSARISDRVGSGLPSISLADLFWEEASMAVPVCPDCGTTIEPDWDWCNACGFDPEGIRPPDWTPSTGALRVFPPAADRGRDPSPDAAIGAPAVPSAGSGSGAPHPLDLLRPPAAGVAVGAVTATSAGSPNGPLAAPRPESEHQPLTLDDLRRSTTSTPATTRAPAPTPTVASAPATPAADERPPLFPAPAAASVDSMFDDPADRTAATDLSPGDVAPVAPVAGGPGTRPPGGADSHPYFDLPYDDPSPTPGAEPAPEPTSRLRRRKPADDRPNAASMAMAAGRVPAEGAVLDASPVPGSTLPPPPGAAAVEATAPVRPSVPANDEPAETDLSGALGPIRFGQPSPIDALPAKAPKGRSSPLSVVAILMTIAIAVIVLWPTYQNLLDSESTPALPPPSAGPIGFAPAQADGSRAAIDPQRTSSWATSAPAGAGFEIDVPGVVVINDRTIPIAGGSAEAIVASASTGRGGFVVAAVEAPSDRPWTGVAQAADSILDGFDDISGNEFTVGPSTTVGGLPALTVEGAVDGVPSKGAIVLVGDRAYLAVGGNASASDLDRFLSSFRPVP